MDLAVKLSPVVYQFLYQLLAEDQDFAPILEDRLMEINEPPEFLKYLAQTYGKAYLGAYKPLPASHAVFASWLMAPLRELGSSDDLQSNLNNKIQSYLADNPIDSSKCNPDSFRPFILAWVVCGVQGHHSRDLPLSFPMDFKDPNVHAAYVGLSEHLALILSQTEGRSELMMNSILWRVSGLLEGIVASRTNQKLSPKECFTELERTNNRVLSPLRLTGWQSYDDVGDYRNVLTHMSQQDKVTFLDASNKGRQRESVSDFVNLARMIARFIAAEINALLLEIQLPGEADWNNLVWDVDLGG